MRHWLVKSEPQVYAYAKLVEEGRTCWNGVRNALARNFLKEMQTGDRVLYYHSQEGKEVVGEAEVARAHYPDPTAPDDPRWVAVDLVPVRGFPRAVPLARFKEDELLRDSYLVRQGRLSVMPVAPEQYARVLTLAGA